MTHTQNTVPKLKGKLREEKEGGGRERVERYCKSKRNGACNGERRVQRSRRAKGMKLSQMGRTLSRKADEATARGGGAGTEIAARTAGDYFTH